MVLFDFRRKHPTVRLTVLVGGVCLVFLYCEYIIYYVVIVQCSWPTLNDTSEPLTAVMVADLHLLGPRKGHWLDKWRRESQMSMAFAAVMHVHRPDVVFFLGDIFDEGAWSRGSQFVDYVERFERLFPSPAHVRTFHVAGNHDIGFHYETDLYRVRRFEEQMDAPSVRLVTVKGNHFVLLNSVAMEGDKCSLCQKSVQDVVNISNVLNCWKGSGDCYDTSIQMEKYSRPILMQHFPLYRESDMVCDTEDAAPLRERRIPFRNKIDALSKQSTEFLVRSLLPRAAFGAHTHHGCLVRRGTFPEFSLASFSWRNRPDPIYYLVQMTPEEINVSTCSLPKETTIAVTAVVSLAVLLYIVVKIHFIARTYRRFKRKYL